MEADKYVAPSFTLLPKRRLEIYFQQYWWRLLTALQEVFPTLVRLFGSADFNEQIAVPYILKHPPNHWSLAETGRHLPSFLEKNYHKKDRIIILATSKIDWDFWEIFLISPKPPLCFKQEEIPALLNSPLQLQPHVRLHTLPFHLPKFREKLLKQPNDYWLNHTFPKLPQENPPYHFLLFRTLRGNVGWESLSKAEIRFLLNIQAGKSLNDICLKIEKKQDAHIQETKENLPFWINKWIKLSLLT